MKKYTHVKFDERDLFKDLLLSDSCKKKNGTINLSEIARQTGRDINTIKREIKRFKNIEDYTPYKAQKDYKQKRKNVLKNYPNLQKNRKND